jgi:hypothetical protein
LPGIGVVIEKIKDDVAEILEPSTQYLVEKRFAPDWLTLIGFVINIWFGVLSVGWNHGVVGRCF